MDKKDYSLKIVTPQGLHSTFEKVTFCSVTGKTGEIGIYPDHSPALFELNPSQINIKCNEGGSIMFVPSGILHISEESVSLLVPYIETIDDISEKRAEEARNKAVKRIANPIGIDLLRAEQSLLRSQERLFLLSQNNKTKKK
ncbi:F0F1 ATP synthase subunit epsilon [bacterium]|jgi:F-type H+-transporting ATPase subunit epsilon|nr:F0F1 ATP synthase subunit epsilon [bacterium]